MATTKYLQTPQDEVEAMSRGRGVGGRWGRGKPRSYRRPITIREILAWADEHHRLTGRYPRTQSKPLGLPTGLTWFAVRAALDRGQYGLPGGSSLVKVLAEHRGYEGRVSRLSVDRILAWADAHHAATGGWPMGKSGPIIGAMDEFWGAIDSAMRFGRRGLPGGSSLAQLLEERRQLRNPKNLPDLEIDQILAWADAHRSRTGRWPRACTGPVAEMPGQSWAGVEAALRSGGRGLPGGSSLPVLIAEHRGARRVQTSRPLAIEPILAWADAHREATGKWPTEDAGPVAGVPGESWGAISQALAAGKRELPGGSSLARLLAERRGARNHLALPSLTLEQIQSWAEAHRAAHRRGRWPTMNSGPVIGAPAHGETWSGINSSLLRGCRGLPGGFSLGQFLGGPRSRPMPIPRDTIDDRSPKSF